MSIATLHAKVREFQACLGELERSQALEELVPGIFDDGQPARTRWRKMPDGPFFFEVMHEGKWRQFTVDQLPQAIAERRPGPGLTRRDKTRQNSTGQDQT